MTTNSGEYLRCIVIVIPSTVTVLILLGLARLANICVWHILVPNRHLMPILPKAPSDGPIVPRFNSLPNSFFLYQVNQSNTGLHPQLIYIYYFIGLLDHGLVRKVIIILRPTLLATISSISSTKMTLPSSGECQETVVHHQSLSVTLKVKD